MKKYIILFSTLLLVSCGKDKKENIEIEKKSIDKYSLVIEGVYEKDDSLVVFYQINNYIQYEKPISKKIIGSNLPQRLKLDIPEGITAENFSVTLSTNKSQENITITNMSLENNGKTILDGSNYKFSEYFLTDASFEWDKERANYKLIHTNQYPPGMVGSEKLISILANK
jgi:hypothetical protein